MKRRAMKLAQMKAGAKLRCRQLAAGTEAAEIAEAALVLPIVFMLLFGIIWFGRAFNVYTTITYAAREGAQVAAQPSCATCGNASKTGSDVATRVIQVLQASHIDTSSGKIHSYTPVPAPVGGTCGALGTSSDPSGVTLYTNVQLNPGSLGPPACGVVVTFQYPFQFYFPFTSLNNQIINLKADAQMQLED
jgi:Flp pilus assembly protein TadG